MILLYHPLRPIHRPDPGQQLHHRLCLFTNLRERSFSGPTTIQPRRLALRPDRRNAYTAYVLADLVLQTTNTTAPALRPRPLTSTHANSLPFAAMSMDDMPQEMLDNIIHHLVQDIGPNEAWVYRAVSSRCSSCARFDSLKRTVSMLMDYRKVSIYGGRRRMCQEYD
jgi:hypothetical protein